jgi:hypothetical protein
MISNYFELGSATAIKIRSTADGAVAIGNTYASSSMTPIVDDGGQSIAASVILESGYLTTAKIGSTPPSLTFAQLLSQRNGTLVYCTNCNKGVEPCTTGGAGALAIKLAAGWKCL